MYFYNMHEGGIAPSRPPLKKLIIQLMSHFWTPMVYIYGGNLHQWATTLREVARGLRPRGDTEGGPVNGLNALLILL